LAQAPSTDAKRDEWTKILTKWHSALALHTDHVAALDGEIQQLRANPLLAQTPAARESIATATRRRADALAALNEARHMLAEVLPARARSEGIPPGWLRDANPTP
jgi:hypothetical protein